MPYVFHPHIESLVEFNSNKLFKILFNIVDVLMLWNRHCQTTNKVSRQRLEGIVHPKI